MKKVLLLNLTRFGDLLQSQAAIFDLHAQGYAVGLVCLENFSEAAQLLGHLSYVQPLPSALFLASLDADAGYSRSLEQMGNARPWHAALADLAAWRDKLLREFDADIVCNLTSDTPSRLLAHFLAGERPCAGFAVDAFGFGVNGNSWAAFLQGASLERGVSPFNIVDLFRKTAQVGEHPSAGPGNSDLVQPPEAARSLWRQQISANAPPDGKGFVGLQLGASRDIRRWPVDYFATLGDRLWHDEGLCPVLFGSTAERPLADRYRQLAAHPFCDLTGQTGIGELAAALCALRLLVTNDTGTMHLAAGLKVPVLAIFLATAQPFDTGPYREGSVSLEPDMDCHPCGFNTQCPHDQACRRSVPPAFVAGLALSFLRDGGWRVPEGPAEVRVWQAAREESGLMGLASLSGHGTSPRAAWLCLQRGFMRRYLDRRDNEQCFGQGIVCPPLPEAMCARLLEEVRGIGRLVDLFLQQGRVLRQKDVPLMRERFLATWQKIYAALRGVADFAALAIVWLQETQAVGRELPDALDAAERFLRLLAAIERLLSGGSGR